MRGVFLGAACVAVTAGLASASSTQLKPTLSFTVAAGVSDYDNYVSALGGGICLDNARVTDPKEDAGVAWSPDGRRVVFYRATSTLTAAVFVANADGSHLRNLTRGYGSYSWDPSWSPDGSRIVFVRAAQTEQLVTMRPDGSDKHPIPGTTVNEDRQLQSPRWAPDRQWVGLALTDGIHLIPPAGSSEH